MQQNGFAVRAEDFNPASDACAPEIFRTHLSLNANTRRHAPNMRQCVANPRDECWMIIQ